MASLIPNLEPSPDTTPEFKRKKRRKMDDSARSFDRNKPNQRIKRWRTEREQQIYSSKFIEALSRSRLSSSTSSAAGKEVRETADRVLAASAKGTTRWSRAILANRLSSRAKMRKHKKVAKVTASRRLRKPEITRDNRKLPAVQRKLKALGRLVPGCKKLSVTNLLEETSDYIAALEMQVRAMTAITEFLAAGGDGGAQPPAARL